MRRARAGWMDVKKPPEGGWLGYDRRVVSGSGAAQRSSAEKGIGFTGGMDAGTGLGR